MAILLRPLLLLAVIAQQVHSLACPAVSPATGLENQFYTWKAGQNIRYQQSKTEGPPVVLVHGLFVNSDHWRKTLNALEGYSVYALDLWGCGYSDKPLEAPTECNGEVRRFVEGSEEDVLRDVELGSAGGVQTRVQDVELRHPSGSPYNFYSWSDLIRDFCRDVVQAKETITLVSNSIGTISSLQAVLDEPDQFNGVFVISPNFRELHSAEVPFSGVTMPVLRRVQSLLREKGQIAFDALAKPDTVKTILQEPYAVSEAVDDTLVQVLLDPLLEPGASRVVFDTLSYSAGPLPEQQLSSFPKPVWVCYGLDDPWTPGARVEALKRFSCVERVDGWGGVGHCPHDEAPERVNPLLVDFLSRVHSKVAV